MLSAVKLSIPTLDGSVVEECATPAAPVVSVALLGNVPNGVPFFVAVNDDPLTESRTVSPRAKVGDADEASEVKAGLLQIPNSQPPDEQMRR